MDSAGPRGGSDAVDRFRLVLNATIVATFLLIVIGGIVRVSESGLGCGPPGSGTHGWPLCEGQLIPLLEGSTLIEFTHRVVAGIVGMLTAGFAWIAYRRLRDRRLLVGGSALALVLVLVQAALGGLTVEHNLDEALVAAHLGLAMLLLAVMLALRTASRGEKGTTSPPPAAGRGLRALSVAATTLVLATIVAGGWVAGTEREGARGAVTVHAAHLACGKEFPTCLGEFMPFGISRFTDIHLTHRAFMYLAAIAVLALFILARRRGVHSVALDLALGLLALQIALGALNVWLGEHAGLIVAHLTVGTLLWASVVQATLNLVPLPARRPSATRPAAGDEAPAAVGA